MSEVEKWMEGKSPTIAATALGIALTAPEVSEALAEMREQADIQISQPPITEWLSFYKNHKTVLDLLENLFSFDGMQKLVAESITGKETDFSSQERDQFLHLYKQPATLFFLKVWGPCAIYYKTTPTLLIRQARLGKVSAFEKLLKLHNAVVLNQKHPEIFHMGKGQNNKKDYRKLLLAFHKPVTGRADPKHIKSLAAAIISLMSESLGKRLTEPQIRKLFDAIAIDRGQGLQDDEIPPTPDTFSQAIRREGKKMKSVKRQPYKR